MLPQCGESITATHIRQAPVREKQLNKLVSAGIRSLNADGAYMIKPNHQVIFFDGGSPGHEKRFRALFKDDEGVELNDLQCRKTLLLY